MKKLTLILALAALAGCASLTPSQQRWATAGAAVLITGAVYAYQDGSGSDARGCPQNAFDCHQVK